MLFSLAESYTDSPSLSVTMMRVRSRRSSRASTCRVLSGVRLSSSDREDDTTAARFVSALCFSVNTMSREARVG